MAQYGIEPIDLVVSNLYPFGSDPALFEHGRSPSEIELIDIGGPALVRAAAKNHAHVGVVVDPDDYGTVLDELRTDGALGDDDPHDVWPVRRSPTQRPTTRRS